MVEGRRMHMLSIMMVWNLPWPRPQGLHVGSRGQRRLMYKIKQHLSRLQIDPDPPNFNVERPRTCPPTCQLPVPATGGLS